MDTLDGLVATFSLAVLDGLVVDVLLLTFPDGLVVLLVGLVTFELVLPDGLVVVSEGLVPLELVLLYGLLVFVDGLVIFELLAPHAQRA